jgi:hypothetical protein
MDADLKYNGEFTLSLQIDFVINVPYPKKTIRFPAILGVSVEQVIGKVCMLFIILIDRCTFISLHLHPLAYGMASTMNQT